MILVVYGTRPEGLKLAPVVRLAKSRGLPVHVHCTMQSPDLVDKAILPWDTEGGGGYELILPVKPSLVVVQGDTRTAFESAVWAYEQGTPVFHLEAGVRTYDLASPWPEEGYRQMISRVATYHACTTPHNLLNLDRESHVPWLDADRARVTGSPIVESVRERAKEGWPVPRMILTLHRRENRGHFGNILAGVDDVCQQGDVGVQWYGHPNSWAAQEARLVWLGFVVKPPCEPSEFATELATAACVITDSGGVQEECNALGVPCVVAREKTDRPESLGKGGAILAGVTAAGVSQAIREALQLDRSTIDRTIFGDGTASAKIVDWWQEIVG